MENYLLLDHMYVYMFFYIRCTIVPLKTFGQPYTIMDHVSCILSFGTKREKFLENKNISYPISLSYHVWHIWDIQYQENNSYFIVLIHYLYVIRSQE